MNNQEIVMKKNLFILLAVIIAVTASAVFAAGGSWRVIKDSNCNKCVINNVDRKCGQCGSFMKSGKMENSDNGYFYEATFTCTNANCGHTVRGAYK